MNEREKEIENREGNGPKKRYEIARFFTGDGFAET